MQDQKHFTKILFSLNSAKRSEDARAGQETYSSLYGQDGLERKKRIPVNGLFFKLGTTTKRMERT